MHRINMIVPIVIDFNIKIYSTRIATKRRILWEDGWATGCRVGITLIFKSNRRDAICGREAGSVVSIYSPLII